MQIHGTPSVALQHYAGAAFGFSHVGCSRNGLNIDCCGELFARMRLTRALEKRRDKSRPTRWALAKRANEFAPTTRNADAPEGFRLWMARGT